MSANTARATAKSASRVNSKSMYFCKFKKTNQILLMNRAIRQKIITKLKQRSDICADKLTFKHCAIIANHLDCDPNSVARLFGIANFKPTQLLKPDLELKIAVFLGFANFELLEYALMHEIVWERFGNYCQQQMHPPSG